MRKKFLVLIFFVFFLLAMAGREKQEENCPEYYIIGEIYNYKTNQRWYIYSPRPVNIPWYEFSFSRVELTLPHEGAKDRTRVIYYVRY